MNDPINRENRTGSYKALELLYKEGKLKNIGVSNYTPAHLEHLLEFCTVVPQVHQFELHPCLYQPQVLDICQKNQIQVQAYSSLGEGNLVNGKIEISGLQKMADRLEVSSALVLLHWAIQHGWAIIPKSKTTDRIKENAKASSFELSKQVSIKYKGLL